MAFYPKKKLYKKRGKYKVVRPEVVRLVVEGKSEVLPFEKAMAIAREKGLDLVEITENVTPTVCKILDYGKYSFELKKRKKKALSMGLKEVKLTFGMGRHDYNNRLSKAKSFLEEGEKVKISLMLVRHQNANSMVGQTLMLQAQKDLEETGIIDVPLQKQGKVFCFVLRPKHLPTPKD